MLINAPIVAVAALTAISLNVDTSGRVLPPARVSVAIDTSGASAVLAAALADPAHAAQAADAALENRVVRAMISKMAIYDHKVTAETFKAAVISLANGGSGNPFDLDRLRRDPEPTRRMLTRLAAEHDDISRRLADRLQSFTPDGLDVHGTMFVLVGAAHQNGWVPDQNHPDFYVDLGFHGEEVESLVNSAAHELFHVIQGMVQSNVDSVMEDQPGLPVDSAGTAPGPRGGDEPVPRGHGRLCG